MNRRWFRWLAACVFVALGGTTSGAVDAEAGAPLAFGGATELRHRLAAINSERRELELRAAERGRAYVRLVRLGLLPMSDGFDGLVLHAQRVEMLARVLSRDLSRAEDLQHQSAALTALLAESQDPPEGSLSQLGSYGRSKEAILAAREREAAFERAFRSDWKPSDFATVYGSVGAPTANSSFAALQGRLSFPVEGRAQVEEVSSNGEFGPGLKFHVDASSVPRSVFPGKVILVGDYGSLGRAVVIEHGGGYSTLSANLELVHVEAGQQLAAGSPLGKLRGSADARELYFELRVGGTPVSPAEWFGL